jgi:hypothetical protein
LAAKVVTALNCSFVVRHKKIRMGWTPLVDPHPPVTVGMKTGPVDDANTFNGPSLHFLKIPSKAPSR